MPNTNNDKHQNVEQNLDRISEEEQETIIKDTDKLIEEMTKNQEEQNQKYDSWKKEEKKEDQTNEEVAERLKPRLGEGGINERADYDTEREPDHHLPGQTDFYFGGHNLHP